MITQAEFHDLVSNAFQALYDFVALRNHPLTRLMITDDQLDPKERGWQMHHMLLDVVGELDPGPAAPPFSKEWRRHRLIVLRYIETLEPQTVADQLAISRRQFYREHAAALEAIAHILWERCDTDAPASGPPASASDQNNAMQIELARISQTDSYADVAEVLEGTLAVLDRVLRENDIRVERVVPDDLPPTSIGHNLLRQVLLGMMGFFIEHARRITLSLVVQPTGDSVSVHITGPQMAAPDAIRPHLALLQTMLRLDSATIDWVGNADARGFMLELPLEYDATVLAVDDNDDTLALYRRCLTPNRYRVIIARTGQPVLHLARETHPDVIILDLMMPNQDGWDLLQLLTNQPDTRHIPIMICSVLKQRQLALSLGAAAFLEKPFTEYTLLRALDALRADQP